MAVETDEQVRERTRRRATSKQAWWENRVPKLYAEASLDKMEPAQQPEQLVAWLQDPDLLTLFLAGPMGTGKTYAAYALCRSAAETMWVEAWNAVELLDALLPSSGAPETLYSVLECDLLLLDDLFAPKVTDWALQTMYRISDRRVNSGLRQIVTTNGAFPDLVEKWGGPTMDRLSYRSQAVKILGKSRREALW